MNPKQYQTRREIAQYLTDLGFPVAPATLAKYATLGGGPVMRKFGRRALYDPVTSLEWAQSKLSSPRRSTSDKGEGV